MLDKSERFRPERSIAVGLDAARALAALYVVVHHISVARGVGGALGVALRFGQEAVIVFFVLSGVVIFLNEYNRVQNFANYGLRRIRRIYPALFVAFLISIAVALDNGSLNESFRASELIGNILGLQDIGALKPGVWVEPFLGNSPLWSLSYELAFYVFFPLIMIVWRKDPATASHIVGAVSCFAYISYLIVPNHLSLVLAYFQVWWLGAMVSWAMVRGGRSILSAKIELCWTIALCIVAGVGVFLVGYKGLGYYPFLQFRHFIVALLIVAAFAGPAGVYLAKKVTFGAVGWSFLASISYGLYVFHYPLLVQWKRTGTVTGSIAGVIALSVAAWLFDRHLNAKMPRAPTA